MTKIIRTLNVNDYHQVLSMETGIEDDYILPIFNRLIVYPNVLYGLFVDHQLVSFAGYTIYAKSYAMLGRLRSDLRYRGKGFATELMSYVMKEAFQRNQIKWVGANTQENNISAQRVLEKLGLKSYPKLYGATAKDISSLETGAKPWTPIHDLQRKQEWLHKVYIEKSNIFPYECYYLFPASKELFQDEILEQWSFYENESNTRFVITKKNEMGDLFLHTIYPWDDLSTQEGLWETISKDFQKLKRQSNANTYIWMDLSPDAVQSLPSGHPFDLPSPWILFGKERSS